MSKYTDLICCDGCIKAFHTTCLKVNPDSLPDPWYCPSCDENREEKASVAYYDENVKSNLSGEFNMRTAF